MISPALRHDTDMTRGSIPRLLIGFAVPLLIGNIFQQTYNTVDSVIVGNFVGKQALAAVGCTGPIINMLIGLFMGLASGAGVVISQFYGAKDQEKLEQSVHTTVVLTLIMCLFITALGVLLTPAMLRLMETPEDVFAQAASYLRIYFWGASGLLLYNIGAGILRAVGDSTRPLYFLIFSAVTNTVLDLLFVKYLGLGIAGAAWATVAAQAMSAALVMGLLLRSGEGYRLTPGKLRITGSILKKICAIGVPSSLQLGITAFSNVFVQSYVNRFDSGCMAGWTAYLKLDAFAMQPLLSLSVALTTFVGQNIGAGDMDRARKGPRYGLVMGFVMMLVILIPLMGFAPQLVSLFNREAEVLRFGSFFIRTISPFYLAFAVNQIYSGALRGAGDTRATMYIMLFSFVLFRQIYLYTVYKMGLGIEAIAYAYPLGWLMCCILLVIYYYSGAWRRSGI